MIKIVYVMTGTEKPEYLNMLRISVASARLQMPSVDIEIVTDVDTGEYILSNHIFDKDVVTINSEKTPDGFTTVEKSRFLKTNLRQLVEGDFLYIDSDTIVCADFSEIKPEASVSLVLDEHVPLYMQENSGSRILSGAEKVGISLEGCTRYYNGGVFLVKDDETAHEFFRRWYEKWESTRKPGMHQDQFSLNSVNMEMDCINELDGTWNCQVTVNDKAFSFLRNVKILHYLSIQENGIYRLNDIGLMRKDLTDDEINEIITHPEKQFKPFHFYADDSVEYQVMQGSQFHLAHRLFTRHKALYNRIDKVLSKFRK